MRWRLNSVLSIVLHGHDTFGNKNRLIGTINYDSDTRIREGPALGNSAAGGGLSSPLLEHVAYGALLNFRF